MAQDRPKCTKTQKLHGEFLLISKNTGWFVNHATLPENSLSLYFRMSTTSSDALGRITAGLQAYPQLNPSEAKAAGVGKDVTIRFVFDGTRAVELRSTLELKHTSKTEYYFMRFTAGAKEDADLFEAAKKSHEVDIQVVDSNSGKILRRTVQSMDGFTATVRQAKAEYERLARTQPPGSCSIF